jgi:hypothetical protein
MFRWPPDSLAIRNPRAQKKTSRAHGEIVEGGQHEIHLDFIGEAPERREHAGFGEKVLDKQQV